LSSHPNPLSSFNTPHQTSTQCHTQHQNVHHSPPALPPLSRLHAIHSHPPYQIAIIGAAIAGPVLALQILTNPTLHSLFTPILYDSSPSPPSIHDAFSEKSKQYAKDNETSIIRGPAPQTGGAAIGANGLFPLCELGLRNVVEEESHESAAIRFSFFPHREIP
jgi:hypothetical protein